MSVPDASSTNDDSFDPAGGKRRALQSYKYGLTNACKVNQRNCLESDSSDSPRFISGPHPESEDGLLLLDCWKTSASTMPSGR